MTITATQKFSRQTPRKLRLVANVVKKMPLQQALEQLAVIERRSTLVLMKTMKQAIANAVNNHGLRFEDLAIESIQVNGGPTYKRIRAASRGRGNEVKKRTSHIIVKLKTMEAAAPAATKVQPAKLEATAVKTDTVKPTTAAKPKKSKAGSAKA